MADQPLPSIEIYDLDEAFKKIQQLKAKNEYICRRYMELHTEYRQQEQQHDECKFLDAQKQRRIEELEEEVRRLKCGRVGREKIPTCTRVKSEGQTNMDDCGWKALPKWMEVREIRREEEKKEASEQRSGSNPIFSRSCITQSETDKTLG